MKTSSLKILSSQANLSDREDPQLVMVPAPWWRLKGRASKRGCGWKDEDWWTEKSTPTPDLIKILVRSLRVGYIFLEHLDPMI